MSKIMKHIDWAVKGIFLFFLVNLTFLRIGWIEVTANFPFSTFVVLLAVSALELAILMIGYLALWAVVLTTYDTPIGWFIVGCGLGFLCLEISSLMLPEGWFAYSHKGGHLAIIGVSYILASGFRLTRLMRFTIATWSGESKRLRVS